MKRSVPRQESFMTPEIQNPFVHTLHLSKLDLIKVVVMSVTIAPLRLTLVGLCLLLAWPLSAVAVMFRSEEDCKEPLTGWRKCVERPLILLGRLMVFGFSFQNVKVTGVPARATDATMVCAAPHSSFFDTFVMFYCLGIPSSLSKAENAKYPIISALLRFTQPVLVKREDPNSRQNTIKEIQRRARSGGKWPQIVIFPEGTCTNRCCLITFKLGAFHPGVPVQPVCLRYPNKLDTYTWTWEGPPVYTLLWLTLCQINTSLEIQFLPVYKPSEEEIADPKLFAYNVRAVMAKALDLPTTDHTFDDCRLMMKAHTLNLPMSSGLVEFNKLHKKLGISLDQMQEQLEKFRSMDLEGKGHITLEEFSKHLQIPESQSLLEVFEMYDRDGSGRIDFREYMIGLSLVSSPVNTQHTISLAFQLFDSSQRGYISQEDLHRILHNAFGMTDIDIEDLFVRVDVDKDGKITYDEFTSYAEEHPEYASLFLAYQELKNAGNGTKLPAVVEEESGHEKSQ